MTPEERFWAKVNKRGPKRKSMKSRCWVWTGGIRKGTNRQGHKTGGYGTFWFEGKNVLAHRMSWFLKHGDWPSSDLDHRCRRRTCVRPSHLREATARENILCGRSPSAMNAKKEKCNEGHSLTGNNLRINSQGRRVCIECARRRGRENERKRRQRMGEAYKEYERARWPRRKEQRRVSHGTGE